MMKQIKNFYYFITFCIVTTIRLVINQIQYFVILHKEEKLYMKNKKAYNRYLKIKERENKKIEMVLKHMSEINRDIVVY